MDLGQEVAKVRDSWRTVCLAFAGVAPNLVVDYRKRKGSCALKDIGVEDTRDGAGIECNEVPQPGVVVGDMAPIPADVRDKDPVVVPRGGVVPPRVQEGLEMLVTKV